MKKDKFCTDCGVTLADHRRSRGYCEDCGYKRMKAAAEQMHAKEGPYYDKWKASVNIHNFDAHTDP